MSTTSLSRREAVRLRSLTVTAPGRDPNDWSVGAQPDPKDRRRIRVSEQDSDRIRSLYWPDAPEATGITDLFTGDDLLVERIDCGLGEFGSDCRCALGIVEVIDRSRDE